MSDSEDSDFTQTYNNVDTSFIISDARRSLGPNYNVIIAESESDESDVSDSDIIPGSPVAPVLKKNIRKIISSDESSGNEIPKAASENLIEEISSDSDSPEKDEDSVKVTEVQRHEDPVIELSSDDEEDLNFVVSPVPSTSADIPKPLIKRPVENTVESYTAALAINKAQELRTKIKEKKTQLSHFKAALKGSEPSQLPDGGEKLRNRLSSLANEIHNLETELTIQVSAMPSEPSFSRGSGDFERTREARQQAAPVTKPSVPTRTTAALHWNKICDTGDIQHGFGAKALESYTAERGSALSALSSLHSALETRPADNEMADPPRSLRKDTKLMPHQLRALAWMMWREKSSGPPGGILADDMGLGKTLTMISLVMKDLESHDSDSKEDDDKDAWTTTKSRSKKSVKGGTLVICPASLLSQWEGEVRRRIRSDQATVEIHHGSRREERGYRLARRTIVVSTYAIVRTEFGSKGALHQVRWRRIILDEAHTVRNYKNKTTEAIFALKGRFRWCLTGTPVHNKELDLFALIKFIGCEPFDNVQIWKRWIDNKAKNGTERLNLLLGSLLLRRTKAQLQTNGELQGLASKELHTILVSLTEQETTVYEKILAFSKSMFAKFLLQRHEREAAQKGITNYKPLDLKDLQSKGAFQPGTKLGKMADKYANMSDIKSHVILVLLLRLRQTCVHATLVTPMLETPTLEPANDEENDELANAMGRLGIKDSGHDNDDHDDLDEVVEDDFWTLDNPVFQTNSVSSKMKAVLDTLLSPAITESNDKAVVVSQWVSMLNLLEEALKSKGIPFVKLCGETKVPDRMKMVDDFNNADSRIKVMLLSLTAGGVGLNLVGANHLLLCDLHWNPQMEAQACDRVYRVGQTKPVNIYKFICKETIEENIQALQEKKMAIATNVLTGARDSSANKLSVDDIKMLFDM